MSETRYDFVIVGGGSAGSVLGNRLSADPSTRVLVLEAGRTDSLWDVYIHMPAALSFPIGNKRYDWRYESEPEPFMGGRRVAHARGKVLGGSSSINGMIFQPGNPMDYDKWGAEPGLERWSYAHCLLACQTCHIPAMARGGVPTKMFWDWSAAGKMGSDGKPQLVKDGNGHIVYDSKKGAFKLGEDVTPEYMWFNGTVKYRLVEEKVDKADGILTLNRFEGSANDGKSRIWPVRQGLPRRAAL